MFQRAVKVTYLGIRSAHEHVWLVEREPIWLPRAYLTRGDLEPARGNLLEVGELLLIFSNEATKLLVYYTS